MFGDDAIHAIAAELFSHKMFWGLAKVPNVTYISFGYSLDMELACGSGVHHAGPKWGSGHFFLRTLTAANCACCPNVAYQVSCRLLGWVQLKMVEVSGLELCFLVTPQEIQKVAHEMGTCFLHNGGQAAIYIHDVCDGPQHHNIYQPRHNIP